AAACRAAALLADMGAAPEDDLRAAARLLRHGALDLARVADLDRGAERGASAAARLDWWGARASRIAADASSSGAAPAVLAALVALADAPAPLGARGPALAAGVELAAKTGQGDLAQRLLAALGEAARELVRRAPPDLAAAV